jgi:hypothetical protein
LCGLGTIVDVALRRGIEASGADIVDRACGRFSVCDFLADARCQPNIISNPPYRFAALLVSHALKHLREGGKVAILVPVGFLASVGRFPLFARRETDELIILSRRPSMPPGDLLSREGEACRGSGSTDYCWAIWQRGRGPGPVRVQWAAP